MVLIAYRLRHHRVGTSIVIVAIGFIAARFAKNEGRLPRGRQAAVVSPVLRLHAALTLGGGSTIGSAQLGYEFGLGGIWLNLSIGLGLVAAGFLVTSKLSKLRALSVNEVVESSYGPIARVFSSALTLIYTLTLSVVQVISIGTIINGVTGIRRHAVHAGRRRHRHPVHVRGRHVVGHHDRHRAVRGENGGHPHPGPHLLQSRRRAAGTRSSARCPRRTCRWAAWASTRASPTSLLYVPGLIIGQDIWQRIFTAKNEKVCRKRAPCLRGRVQRILRAGHRRHRHERVRAAAPPGQPSERVRGGRVHVLAGRGCAG